jgi:hypothetical protein
MLSCLFGYASKHLYIFNLYMTTLAKRDKIINHLQGLIEENRRFSGGTKLSNEEADKLRTLDDYLKDNGRGGEKDLATINALLSQN